MTTVKRFHLLIRASVIALWLHLLVPPLSAAPGQPTISSIQTEGTNLVVTVEVPPGLRRVALEGRANLSAGAWEPRAVQRLDGTGGTVRFILSRSSAIQVLRVRANERDPLPESFYGRMKTFEGRRTVEERFGPIPPESVALAYAADNASSAAVPQVREVEESDIWKLQKETLYYFNQYRGLQVVDLSNSDAPRIRGVYPVLAAGEEIYLLRNGYVVLLARMSCGWNDGETQSQVMIVDTRPDPPSLVSSTAIPGQIIESRLVGSALYLSAEVWAVRTDDNRAGEWEQRTHILSLDLADPAQPVSRGDLSYASGGNVITATDRYLFVAIGRRGERPSSDIHCLDISAPDGTIRRRGTVHADGSVTDKFKMNLDGEVFTVVSWDWNNNSGGLTKVQTFSIADPDSPVKLGEVHLAPGEQLYASRFDGTRLYAVTYRRKDPLWVIDLSDPTQPRLSGELQIPGWSTYLKPWGDRLVTVGIDDVAGSRVAAQLFDVSNPARPALLSKVVLGESYSWSEANENEKAVQIITDAGLILLPYQGWLTNGYASRLQLIDLTPDSLNPRGFIEHRVQPRRATVHHDQLYSISARELFCADVTDRDTPRIRSSLELSWPADQVFLKGGYLLELSKAEAVVRVCLANAPDQVLAAHRLSNTRPIVGATIADGRLYLAQAQTRASWGFPFRPVLFETFAASDTPPGQSSTLQLSIFDLATLPALPLLGSVEALSGPQDPGADFKALWPRPGLLVWAGENVRFWPWWDFGPIDLIARPTVIDIVQPAPPLVGFVDRPLEIVAPGPANILSAQLLPFYGNTERWLIGFDVKENGAAQFLSAVNIGTNGGWNVSEAQAAAGLIFQSHELDDQIVTGTNSFVSTYSRVVFETNFVFSVKFPATNIIVEPRITERTEVVQVTNAYEVVTRIERHYLDVIDYADPLHPTPRIPVNIPGQLQGISHQGAIVYTIGDRDGTENVGSRFLDASAYDETAVSLIDSLRHPNDAPLPIMGPENSLLLVRPPEAAGTASRIERWALSEINGRFGLLNSGSVPGRVDALFRDGGILALQGDAKVRLLDANSLSELGSGALPSCIGVDLRHTAGEVTGGLWVPLGDYGVMRVRRRAGL